jgi:hypothetical protein
MKKSATDLMQEIVFAAVVDSVGALKAASRGVPNTLLRDLNAIHANATFADLPSELQASINASVRTAFARLLKEGYSVAPAGASAPPPRPSGPPRDGRDTRGGEGARSGRRPPQGRGPGAGPGGPGGDTRPPRGPRGPNEGGRPPRSGGRPGGPPKPR